MTATTVRVSSAEGLLAIIPALLRFIPQDSLVVVGVTAGGRTGVVQRYDLPRPGAGTDRVCVRTAAILAANGNRVMAAVAYGPAASADPLMTVLARTVTEAGIEPAVMLRADHGRYWSYLCRNPACCPPDGNPYDPAGYTEVPGVPVFPSRASIAEQIAPLDGDVRSRMRDATRQTERHLSPLPGGYPARPLLVREGLAAVAAVTAAYQAGQHAVSDAEAALLTVTLRDLRVRDDAWARMDPAHRDAHLRLWTDVTRRAEPGYVAAPASLLAFCAWQAGNGTLANVALDRALADDPAYSMAALLRDVIAAGASPALATPPMTPEQVAEEYRAQT